ncbi:MAG: hypothetical protein IJW04_01360 [Ruminococcus sp.]|nr:hypothetical protein [Ruminococcus sp.]
MKKLKKKVNATTNIWNEEYVLSIQTLLELLNDIPELRGLEIGVSQHTEDYIIINIGGYEYDLLSIS